MIYFMENLNVFVHTSIPLTATKASNGRFGKIVMKAIQILRLTDFSVSKTYI